MNRFCLNRFDCIIYINLDSRPDRRERLLAELAHVDADRIHRIAAVEDRENGHRGCLKSHIAAIEYAKHLGVANALILEDDCYFKQPVDQVGGMIEHFLQAVDVWDVFVLGSHVRAYESTEWERVFRILQATCAQAYCINCHYYDVLLECFEGVLANTVFEPLDRSWHALMQRDRWFCSDIVLHQRTDFSDIEKITLQRIHPETLQ